MTSLPAASQKKLGLVIDLDVCVGCQACATSCKEWNTQGVSAPLSDAKPRGAEPMGTWLNRIHGYEVHGEGREDSRIVHFPRSCLHCEDARLRHRLPDGCLLQARRRRHRAGQSGNLHRLQALLMGLPLWRARV
jgi:Fe-S-cluster-containing dehydrogenase component